MPLFGVLLADWLLAGRALRPATTSSTGPPVRTGEIVAWLAGFALYQWLLPQGPSWWLDLIHHTKGPVDFSASLPSFAAAFLPGPARRVDSLGACRGSPSSGTSRATSLTASRPGRAALRTRRRARCGARRAGARGREVRRRRPRAVLAPPLVALGLPVLWRPGDSTATFSFHYDGDRAHDGGARDSATRGRPRTSAGRSPARAGCTSGALARSDFPAETLAELARGRRVSFDGQGLVRPARTGPLELDADFDPEVLRHVSILKLAEEEAEALLGGEPTEQALRELGVPEVLVTLGSRGSLVLADGRLEHVDGRARSRATRPAPATRSRPPTSSRARPATRRSPRRAQASALVAGLLSGRLR